MALCGVALASLLHTSPRDADRDATAIFAHDISFDEAAARVNNAGAGVLGVGATANDVVARLTNPTDTQSLQALREAGAWLFRPANTQDLCAPTTWSVAANTNNATSS